MNCPNCNNKITEQTVKHKGDKIYCANCDKEIEYKQGIQINSQDIIKIVVGIAFIFFGAFLLFRTINNTNTSSINLSYKYDQVTASLTKTDERDGGVVGYYEYTYNDITYKAIGEAVYKTSADVPKNQTVNVNKTNPEDYVFETSEEKEVNKSVYAIPIIIMLFGFASVILSLKNILL